MSEQKMTNDALAGRIDALLELDAAGAIAPIKVCGLARALLEQASAALRARAVQEVAVSDATGKIDQNSYTTGWNDCQQQIGDDRMPGIRYAAEYLRERVNLLRTKGVSLSVIDVADMLTSEVERLVPFGTSGFGDASMNDTAMLAASQSATGGA